MVTDNYIERYKQKNDKTLKVSVDWIENSINQVDISKCYVDNKGELVIEDLLLKAVHIFKEKEGPDNAVLYTYRDDGLQLGDMIVKQAFDKNGEELLMNREVFLLFEEAPRVDGSTDIRVFSTIEANAIIKEANGTYFLGYFKGEMRSESQIDYALKVNLATLDSLAMLIVPRREFQVLNRHIFTEIKSTKTGESSYFSWEVSDKDDITTSGMQYVSIKKILREPEIIIEDPEEEIPTDPEEPTEPVVPAIIAANSTVEVVTSGGYFAADQNVKILQRKATLVVFEAPIMPGELNISTKNAEGEIITTKYMVII